LFDDSHPLAKPDPVVKGTDPEDRPDLFVKTEEPEPPKQGEPQAPPPPGFGPREMAAAISMASEEQARRSQAAREWEENQRRLAASLAPPKLPETEEELEALILDGSKVRDVLWQQQQWAQRALQTQAQMLNQHFQQTISQVQAPMWNDRRDRAMEDAAEELEAAGFESPDQLVVELENQLRANPQTYWDIVTDPRSLVRGAKLIADEMGIQRGAPRRGAPISLGYNRSTTPGPAAVEPRYGSAMVEQAVRRAENAFGIKFNEDRRNALLQKLEEQGIR